MSKLIVMKNASQSHDMTVIIMKNASQSHDMTVIIIGNSAFEGVTPYGLQTLMPYILHYILDRCHRKAMVTKRNLF